LRRLRKSLTAFTVLRALTDSHRWNWKRWIRSSFQRASQNQGQFCCSQTDLASSKGRWRSD
jgi:hypothetical protein